MPSCRIFLLCLALGVATSTCTTAPRTAASTDATISTSPRNKAFPGARCSLESWHLDEATSRAVVLRGPDGIIVAGGLTAGGSSTSRVVVFDPSTGRERALAKLAVPTHDAGGTSIGAEIYVFGGGESSTTDAVQRVDAAGGSKVTTLPQPRSDLSVARAGGQAVIVGGYDGTTLLSSVLATADGMHFHMVASLPQPLRYVAVASIGSTVYVLGGTDGPADSSDIQSIDVSTGKATIIGHLPERLSHAVAVADGGAVWIFGGRVRGLASRAIFRFDPSTGKTSAAGVMPLSISDAGAVVAAGRAYIVGGETSVPRDSVIGCALR